MDTTLSPHNYFRLNTTLRSFNKLLSSIDYYSDFYKKNSGLLTLKLFISTILSNHLVNIYSVLYHVIRIDCCTSPIANFQAYIQTKIPHSTDPIVKIA